MAKKDKTYTQAIDELNEILEKLESGEMDVDVLSVEIKKAAALLKFCKDKLYKTDEEVRKTLENLD